jgi:hypothetical protein
MSKTDQEIVYACDADGDHTAPMADCTDSDVKSFDNEQEKNLFIVECTYVYNLDIALGNKVNVEGTPNPVLDCLEENCI